MAQPRASGLTGLSVRQLDTYSVGVVVGRMKAYILVSVGLRLLVGGAWAFALPAQLSNGIYETTGSDCWVQVLNDPRSGGLATEYLSSAQGQCPSDGQITNYTRASATQYVSDQVLVVDMAWIANCSPSATLPLPCETWYYDVQTGALLAQIGDQIDFVDRVTVLNANSLQNSQTEVWSRGGVVFHSNLDLSAVYIKK